MNLNQEDRSFLESLAKSDTGRHLVKLLKSIETYYADIRNVGDVDPKVRIDALKMFREALLEKLLVMSGEIDPPNNDEYY
jgi:hypothetical protein